MSVNSLWKNSYYEVMEKVVQKLEKTKSYKF